MNQDLLDVTLRRAGDLDEVRALIVQKKRRVSR
jgi:hypothetical protein